MDNLTHDDIQKISKWASEKIGESLLSMFASAVGESIIDRVASELVQNIEESHIDTVCESILEDVDLG